MTDILKVQHKYVEITASVLNENLKNLHIQIKSEQSSDIYFQHTLYDTSIEYVMKIKFQRLYDSMGVFIEATRLETGTLVATRVANTIALLSTASQVDVFIAATQNRDSSLLCVAQDPAE